jgi:hypothetical protein
VDCVVLANWVAALACRPGPLHFAHHQLELLSWLSCRETSQARETGANYGGSQGIPFQKLGESTRAKTVLFRTDRATPEGVKEAPTGRRGFSSSLQYKDGESPQKPKYRFFRLPIENLETALTWAMQGVGFGQRPFSCK